MTTRLDRLFYASIRSSDEVDDRKELINGHQFVVASGKKEHRYADLCKVNTAAKRHE